MLDGMGMMLKALGIDPASLQEGLKIAEAKVEAVESALLRIEQRLDYIGSHSMCMAGYEKKFLTAPGEGVNDARNSNQN